MSTASMLSSGQGLQDQFRRQAFRAGPRPARSLRVRCRADESLAATSESVLDRRVVLAAGLASGFIPALSPKRAQAEGACTDFSTAANGIKWCDTKEGSGKTPNKGQLIRCHYTGRLTSNNQVFDSSYERRRPLTFKVGAREVIQGWDKSIIGEDDLPPMKEGGKRRVVIPPELGYGSRGAGGVIPPNATLTFDIELLGKR